MNEQVPWGTRARALAHPRARAPKIGAIDVTMPYTYVPFSSGRVRSCTCARTFTARRPRRRPRGRGCSRAREACFSRPAAPAGRRPARACRHAWARMCAQKVGARANSSTHAPRKLAGPTRTSHALPRSTRRVPAHVRAPPLRTLLSTSLSDACRARRSRTESFTTWLPSTVTSSAASAASSARCRSSSSLAAAPSPPPSAAARSVARGRARAVRRRPAARAGPATCTPVALAAAAIPPPLTPSLPRRLALERAVWQAAPRRPSRRELGRRTTHAQGAKPYPGKRTLPVVNLNELARIRMHAPRRTEAREERWHGHTARARHRAELTWKDGCADTRCARCSSYCCGGGCSRRGGLCGHRCGCRAAPRWTAATAGSCVRCNPCERLRAHADTRA